jgi:hypothetical protein
VSMATAVVETATGGSARTGSRTVAARSMPSSLPFRRLEQPQQQDDEDDHDEQSDDAHVRPPFSHWPPPAAATGLTESALGKVACRTLQRPYRNITKPDGRGMARVPFG